MNDKNCEIPHLEICTGQASLAWSLILVDHSRIGHVREVLGPTWKSDQSIPRTGMSSHFLLSHSKPVQDIPVL